MVEAQDEQEFLEKDASDAYFRFVQGSFSDVKIKTLTGYQ
jgi:hypothetical protein